MDATTMPEARTTDRIPAVVVALLLVLIGAAVVLGHAVSAPADATTAPAAAQHVSAEAG